MVFPELSTCGYAIESRKALETMAIEPYNDNFINDLRELTKKFSATIVMGIPERDGNKIYNSSALIDSGKIAGT